MVRLLSNPQVLRFYPNPSGWDELPVGMRCVVSAADSQRNHLIATDAVAAFSLLCGSEHTVRGSGHTTSSIAVSQQGPLRGTSDGVCVEVIVEGHITRQVNASSTSGTFIAIDPEFTEKTNNDAGCESHHEVASSFLGCLLTSSERAAVED